MIWRTTMDGLGYMCSGGGGGEVAGRRTPLGAVGIGSPYYFPPSSSAAQSDENNPDHQQNHGNR